MSMFRKKDEGFTLVELMVVVLIIGILVAIAIPVFNSARANAEKRSCQANVRTVNGAIQTYHASLQEYPGNLAALAAVTTVGGTDYGPFVAAVPTCPGAGSYVWTPWVIAAPNVPPSMACSLTPDHD